MITIPSDTFMSDLSFGFGSEHNCDYEPPSTIWTISISHREGTSSSSSTASIPEQLLISQSNAKTLKEELLDTIASIDEGTEDQYAVDQMAHDRSGLKFTLEVARIHRSISMVHFPKEAIVLAPFVTLALRPRLGV